MKKCIFLDFNVTVLDDVDLCLNLLNEMLALKGVKTVSMEEYKELLIIKGKYEELKSQQIKPILYRETEPIIKEYGNNPIREIFATDPLPATTSPIGSIVRSFPS